MQIIWTRPARRDVRSQVLYLAERSPAAARRMQATIREAVERLADYPNRGRPGRYEGTRELVVAGSPYIVIYRVRETSLHILRVLHGAQGWPPEAS